MINKILISLLMLSSLAFSNSAIQLTTKVTDITLKELIDLGYERTNRIVEANVMFCRSYGIANQEDNKLIEKHNEITRREFTIGVNDGANELVNGKFRFVGVNNKDYLIYKTTIPTKKFTKITFGDKDEQGVYIGKMYYKNGTIAINTCVPFKLISKKRFKTAREKSAEIMDKFFEMGK